MAINIVLFEPEIPPNTGNIARTCAATSSVLHLIKPLGFSIDDKHLKRAGLDYWDLLEVHMYENIDEFFSKNAGGQFFLSTTKGEKFYTDVKYEDGCFIIFGKETAGLPDKVRETYKETCVRVPMIPNEKARSLNLSNTVNIVLYEALRQTGFKDLI